jgi:hypothetical protein
VSEDERSGRGAFRLAKNRRDLPSLHEEPTLQRLGSATSNGPWPCRGASACSGLSPSPSLCLCGCNWPCRDPPAWPALRPRGRRGALTGAAPSRRSWLRRLHRRERSSRVVRSRKFVPGPPASCSQSLGSPAAEVGSSAPSRAPPRSRPRVPTAAPLPRSRAKRGRPERSRPARTHPSRPAGRLRVSPPVSSDSSWTPLPPSAPGCR